MDREYDLVVVGAGILGLAHALHAARRGLKVAVLDRDAQANGASIRNFGFVTVTGQGARDTWRRARRSRDIWAEVAALAGIAVHHRGLLMTVRRPEAAAVIEEFAAGPMGEGCRVLHGTELAAHAPPLRADHLLAALHSPHELRVESRDAIPRLAGWMEAALGVRFHRRVAVHAVEAGRVETAAGTFRASRIVVCPGPDIATLFPDAFARRGVTLCKLHMLRLADPGWRLPAAVMSDLGLHRYRGYAECPSLPALRARLATEQPEELAHGVHLIVVQSADGSLVVGDSHHYGDTPDPFQPEEVDALILNEARAVLDLPAPRVVERWTGLYPSASEDAFFEAPARGVRLVSVTSGTGASTAFGLAEEVLADLEANP
ncbi:TIGR03364 family FAD-dependent oxidoreductase [Roseomonas eburnea]|uniref:TIGR03364 family FAD-dependent oxidoreductase n=1 Tax=Neoroseomonas eburnea TaxID=1346889 RepID=A0A9X9X9J4_9PROT|nr:TIGR03364 family FAD-dependent oxidoreductase [Neoroseomonas eburnea]MBR0680380.1 TIGR03364 family FAD-dependent oxidoreductase [Neoroseomonas eburnea]